MTMFPRNVPNGQRAANDPSDRLSHFRRLPDPRRRRPDRGVRDRGAHVAGRLSPQRACQTRRAGHELVRRDDGGARVRRRAAARHAAGRRRLRDLRSAEDGAILDYLRRPRAPAVASPASARALSCSPRRACSTASARRPTGAAARSSHSAIPKCGWSPTASSFATATVWSSAGITAGVDLALAMIADDLGETVARRVAQQLVVYRRRPGGQSQFSALLEMERPDGRFGTAARLGARTARRAADGRTARRARGDEPAQFRSSLRRGDRRDPAARSNG